jgi:hypothetical protein
MAVSVASASGSDVTTVRSSLKEAHLYQRVQELTAERIVEVPQPSRLISTEIESGHFAILPADAFQHVLSKAGMDARRRHISSWDEVILKGAGRDALDSSGGSTSHSKGGNLAWRIQYERSPQTCARLSSCGMTKGI